MERSSKVRVPIVSYGGLASCDRSSCFSHTHTHTPPPPPPLPPYSFVASSWTTSEDPIIGVSPPRQQRVLVSSEREKEFRT